MTDTQRNIKELKAALPRMREKVIAVAVLLALSVTMMASVSYAWYTLSLAPEAGNITTQVSSNGSLEVALAGLYDKDGKLIEPYASAIGDSFSAQGQNTVDANLTWGNLINLSTYYGIEELVLRPASFNSEAYAYLSSMDYGDDGRVSNTTDKFDFTYWTRKTNGNGYNFATAAKKMFGVRAISSVSYPETDVESKMAPAEKYFLLAKENYTTIVTTQAYLDTIESLITTYLNANISQVLDSLGGGEATEVDAEISNDDRNGLYAILQNLLDNAFKNYGEALAAMANAQMGLQGDEFTPYTWDTLRTAKASELAANDVNLGANFTEFRNEFAKLETDVAAIKEYCDNATAVKWSDIQWIINDLISITTVEIMVDTNGNTLTEDGYTVGEVLDLSKTTLLSYAGKLNSKGTPPSTVPIRINAGMLSNFEKWCGTYMYSQISVKAQMMIDIESATLYTKWRNSGRTADFYGVRDLTIDVAEKMDSGALEFTGQKTAKETYGMVIDLWVRTNAANSTLMLDGLVETVDYEALLTFIPSGSSDSEQIYTYTYKTGGQTLAGTPATATANIFLIPYDVDGDGTISSSKVTVNLVEGETSKVVGLVVTEGYFYDTTSYERVRLIDDNGKPVQSEVKDENGSTVTDEDGNILYSYEYLTSEYYLEKMADIVVAKYTYPVVVGFSSSNRVDDDFSKEAVSNISTSATQGSGSCYIFYAESPELADGALELLKHLRIAFCDASGSKIATAKMAVDQVLADGGKYIVPVVIDEGVETVDGSMGITNLAQNTATLISAVVYLDGSGLDNSMVMSKDSIKGSLNLQFASSADLQAKEDDDLSTQTIKLLADIDDSAMDYVAGDPAATTTNLTVVVDGVTPNLVQAVFRRQINASQGAQMDPVTLTSTGAGYSADVTFSAPGTYILRSVWVDGVEYDLPESEWITVVVSGFAVDGVRMDEDSLALTADSFVTRTIYVDFKDGQLGSAVSARFRSDDGKYVSANLSYDTESRAYKGTARFSSSGHYTLTYVVIGDNYYELDAEKKLEFTAYLGLRTRVYLQSSVGLNFPFKGEQEITVMAELLTDTDQPLKNLNNVRLFYGKRGSSEVTNGVNADLTWNGSYYVGTFNVRRVGVYNFSHMLVGSNVITIATNAPTITAYATEPPSYNGSTLYYDGTNTYSDDLILMSDKTVEKASGIAYYVLALNNASGIDYVKAVFSDGSSNWTSEVIVGDVPDAAEEDGYFDEENGVTYVYFRIPDKADGSKSGIWTIEQILISGVYDENGNYYGESEGTFYEVDVTYDFSIVEKLTANVTPITLGSSLDNAAGFMTAQPMVVTTADGKQYITFKINTGGVTLSDFGMQISSVTATLTHGANNENYGGYTYSGSTGHETISNIALSYNASTGLWYVPESQNAYLAGTYTYSLKVTIDSIADVTNGTSAYTDKTFTVNGGSTVALTVWSKKPTVTVKSTTPNGNVNAYSSWQTGLFGRVKGVNTTPYTAGKNSAGTVANVCYIGKANGIYGNFTQPTVTITLAGKGAAAGATLAFADANGGTALTYENHTDALPKAYSWTSGTDCTRRIGLWESVSSGTDKRTIAGTIYAYDLVLTDANGVTYTVCQKDNNGNKLPLITINNPY